MPIQTSGLDHQFWVPKLKTTLLAFNHLREFDFTLSNNCGREQLRPRNNLSFCSFHKTQTQWSQIKWNKDRRDFKPPAYWINCIKWSGIAWESTPSTPSHARTMDHRAPKKGQDKNMWGTSSTYPHPVTQSLASIGIMPRLARLSFVGNMSLSNRHKKSLLINKSKSLEKVNKFLI